MRMLYTILIVGIATALLVSAKRITSLINWAVHPHAFIDSMVKYQAFALIVGILVMLAVRLLSPDSHMFLKTGNLSAIAEKESWLGIKGTTSWKRNGLQLLCFVSLATGIFMLLAVKHTHSMGNFSWHFTPWVLLFALTNAFAEELIYRFGIVGGLSGHYSQRTILIVSAVLFGLPHFMGNPGGFIGVLMSGVLGYILCKATIETKGLFVAWGIHFVLDVIIFTALMMMQVKHNVIE